jgi:flagellar protein FliO/FliZ
MRLPRFMRHPLVLAAAAFALMGLLGLLPGGGEEGPGLPLMRLALALIGILALALAAVPALRRLPAGGRRGGSRLRCEEQLSLGGRHRLALVSADGRRLLLGLQNDGCVLLADLGEAPESADESASGPSFPSSEQLQQLYAQRPEL